MDFPAQIPSRRKPNEKIGSVWKKRYNTEEIIHKLSGAHATPCQGLSMQTERHFQPDVQLPDKDWSTMNVDRVMRLHDLEVEILGRGEGAVILLLTY
jgi:hypothetical protein